MLACSPGNILVYFKPLRRNDSGCDALSRSHFYFYDVTQPYEAMCAWTRSCAAHRDAAEPLDPEPDDRADSWLSVRWGGRTIRRMTVTKHVRCKLRICECLLCLARGVFWSVGIIYFVPSILGPYLMLGSYFILGSYLVVAPLLVCRANTLSIL